ncbi:MAG: hypothetical protein LC733_13255 [Actinobacteria bacterium]|nr:hypothetical protein [Actinomycetota bacterium]
MVVVVVELVLDVELVELDVLVLDDELEVVVSSTDAAGPACPKPSPTRTNAVVTPTAPGKRLRTVHLHRVPPARRTGRLWG